MFIPVSMYSNVYWNIVVVIIKLLGVSGTENCVSLGQDHLTIAS